jgi:glycosyltransferase involved in cell wall biosynthesis
MSEIRNILFISYFYPPASGGGIPAIQRVGRFLKYMKYENAHVVTVKDKYYPKFILLSPDNNLRFSKEIVHRVEAMSLVDTLIDFKKKVIKCFNKKIYYNGTNSQIIAKREEKKNIFVKIKNFTKTLINYPDFARPWALSCIISSCSIIFEHKIDTIFATGMPWTSLIIGAVLKTIFRIKLIVDFRDPWLENPYVEKSSTEKILDKFFEKQVIKKANLVLANTEDLLSSLKLRYRKYEKKFYLVYNGYDPENFLGLPKFELDKNKFIIVHAGLLYKQRDPKDILEAIKKLKKIDLDAYGKIEFHQIGKVNLEYDLKKYSEEYLLKNKIKVIEHMEHKNCLAYMNAAQMLIVIQPGTQTQIPSKIYEYIFFDKPIISISENESALFKLIRNYEFGENFLPGEVTKIAEYLRKQIKIIQINEKDQIKKKKYKKKYLFDVREISKRLNRRIINLKK